MYYVAVDIGCIECGEPSAVLGVFTDKEQAEAVLAEHSERQAGRWGGQHSFELFEVSEIDVVNKTEY